MKKMVVLMATMLMCVTALAFAQDSATKEEAVAKCKEAAKMAQEKGLEETLKVINDMKGPFVWKDSYVFCIDMDKQANIAHPERPQLIGKNLFNIKDKNGKLFFADFINTARDKGEGWVDYLWPKPGSNEPVPKSTYIYRVPGTNVLMAAGVYL
ncbi:MAG: cache domain-containing protein [Thermodesulfobacteriota bacterium]